MSGETSVSLLQRARDGQAEGWERLATLYRPLVIAWCVRGGAGSDAEDLAQEVLLAVSAGLPTFRREAVGGFRAWVRGITRFKLADHFRRRKRNVAPADGGTAAFEIVSELPDPDPESAEDQAETDGLYRRALDLIRAEFTERTWLAFWCVAVEGRETSAVAAELGMSPTAVRIAKSRVLARLREEAGDLIG